MKKLSKSPLFTLNNIHYLCTENRYIDTRFDDEDFSEFQFAESSPEKISKVLPTEIQKQIHELGDSYYTIAILPENKISSFFNILKAILKEKLETIIKEKSIDNVEIFDIIPDLFQNLAALQSINSSLELNDLLPLVTQIDKFSRESLTSQILF